MALAPLPQSAISAMASREHRLWHYLWHGMRNFWERLDSSQRQAILNIYPGWEPPRPALDANGDPLRNNNSGEDFLYMHRTMIMMVNDILAGESDPNYPWVRGWHRVPRPWNSNYPVPPDYSSGNPGIDQFIQDSKEDWAAMEELEQQFTDPEYLGSVTMGELGSDLEWSIHGLMHGRWSAESPVGYRPPMDPIDPQWDQPAYDWLFDTYSSHVNSVFWKLHGWVDDRIEDWKRVHNADDYQWQGTWIGNPPPAMLRSHPVLRHAAPEEAADMDQMKEIAGILASAGYTGYFLDFVPAPRETPVPV